MADTQIQEGDKGMRDPTLGSLRRVVAMYCVAQSPELHWHECARDAHKHAHLSITCSYALTYKFLIADALYCSVLAMGFR